MHFRVRKILIINNIFMILMMCCCFRSQAESKSVELRLKLELQFRHWLKTIFIVVFFLVYSIWDQVRSNKQYWARIYANQCIELCLLACGYCGTNSSENSMTWWVGGFIDNFSALFAIFYGEIKILFFFVFSGEFEVLKVNGKSSSKLGKRKTKCSD